MFHERHSGEEITSDLVTRTC